MAWPREPFGAAGARGVSGGDRWREAPGAAQTDAGRRDRSAIAVAIAATIASYTLDVAILPPTCGDGWVGGTEQCDDGNTVAGDGCNATCGWEGTGEVEPNDTRQQAGTLIPSGNTAGSVVGVLSASHRDPDVFSARDRDMAQLLANCTAPAIETARPMPFTALKRPGIGDFLATLTLKTGEKSGAPDAAQP